MKKRSYARVCLILAAAFLAAYILLKILDHYGITLFLFVIGTNGLCFLLFCLTVLALVFSATLCLWEHHRRIEYFVLFAVVALFFWGIALLPFAVTLGTWHSYDSPDKEHRIVVNERAFLLAGAGTVYEEIFPGILIEVGYYTTDDGHTPFSRGEVQFDWKTDSVVIHYAFGYMESDGIRTIEVNYVKP